MTASVTSFTATPAVGPVIGDTYGIDTPATGAWVGREGQLAQWAGVSWFFSFPSDAGSEYAATIADPTSLLIWDGTAWVDPSSVVNADVMLKSVYDIANDGMADQANAVEYADILSVPTTFAPAAHNHIYTDVTDFLTKAQVGRWETGVEIDTGLFFDPPTNTHRIYTQRFTPGLWPAGTSVPGDRKFHWEIAHGIVGIDVTQPIIVYDGTVIIGTIFNAIPIGTYSSAATTISFSSSADADSSVITFTSKVFNQQGNAINYNIVFDPVTLGSLIPSIKLMYSR